MKGRDGNLMLGDDLEMTGQNRELLMRTRELQGFWMKQKIGWWVCMFVEVSFGGVWNYDRSVMFDF